MGGLKNQSKFFIVGAAKAGTTSLFHYLKQHPQIFLPPIKELNYFSTDIQPENFRADYAKSVMVDMETYFKRGMTHELFHGFISKQEHYEKIFSLVKDQIAVGELSNTYLYSEIAARNIYQSYPNAKIIAVLRNPVERAFSHYQMDFRNGLVNADFLTEFNRDKNKTVKGWGVSNLYFELGMYSLQLKRFLELFPRENILILFHDDWKKNEQEFFRNICRFLKVNENFSFNFSEKHNEAIAPVFPFRLLKNQKRLFSFLKNLMPEAVKLQLKKILKSKKNIQSMTGKEQSEILEFYKDDILKLSQLLNTNLSHWLQ